MAGHSYKLQYRIDRKPEGFTAEEGKAAAEEGVGSCDAILLASIIYPKDGSLSVLFEGQDGRTDTELHDNEWFKVWTLLTARLAQSTTLHHTKRMFCSDIFQIIAEPMRSEARTREQRAADQATDDVKKGG